MQGHRQIMMTPFHQMLKYMAAKQVPMADFSIKHVRDYFMGMSTEALEDYKASASLFHLTLKVHSMLYIPAGDLFVERAGQDNTVFGVKIVVCNGPQASVDALKQIKIAKDQFKKDTKVLDSFISELEAQSAA